MPPEKSFLPYWRQYENHGQYDDETLPTQQPTVWCHGGPVPRAELKVPKDQLREFQWQDRELQKSEWKDRDPIPMRYSPRPSNDELFTHSDGYNRPPSPTVASNDDDQTPLRGDNSQLDSFTQVVPSNTTQRQLPSQAQLDTPTYTATAGASNAVSAFASQAGTASQQVGVVRGQPSLQSPSGNFNPGTFSENDPNTWGLNGKHYRTYEGYKSQESRLQGQ